MRNKVAKQLRKLAKAGTKTTEQVVLKVTASNTIFTGQRILANCIRKTYKQMKADYKRIRSTVGHQLPLIKQPA